MDTDLRVKLTLAPEPEPDFILEYDGVEYGFSEARMSQLGALRDRLGRMPVPEMPPLPVDGTLDLISRGATEILPKAVLERIEPGIVREHLKESRNIARRIVSELMREHREENAYWPPEPDHPRGIHALVNDPGGPEEIVYQALRVCKPAITREKAAELYGLMTLEHFETVLNVFFGVFRKIRQQMAAQAQAAPVAEGDEGAGKAAKREAPKGPKGRSRRPDTTKSTPSS